ncbi:hypothetical protein JAAARDRAFT_159422 [Jaapia argillacea MUCL 33604]|uniref:E2 ubiquitin-conjugating enzyme n=1 Tax=Jaapia argillacea MUCL 33604 TaxID=933084 RepID=A0A067PNP9_9AGAM|nr:hypothetical protein JAAARDRAFT_159422 [Jaapia argillacea MUCL 33604]
MPASMASSMTLKRIHREIADLKKEDLGGITLTPTDSLFLWKASIPGPEGSCYEGGVFNAEIQLAPDYPFSAPKVIFVTRIYHMNISDRGNVCIDILKQNWSPALSIFKVILSLSSLLTDPNPKDPLVPSIANEYVRNRELHNRTAKQWTQLYARPPPPKLPTPPPPTSLPTSSATNGRQINKGKSRAPPPPPPTINGAGGSASAAIAIEDSDSEMDAEGAARARAGTKRRKTRESGTNRDGVLVIDGDDEQVDESPRAPKKRKVTSAGRSRGGGSRTTVDDDVIVIDD